VYEAPAAKDTLLKSIVPPPKELGKATGYRVNCFMFALPRLVTIIFISAALAPVLVKVNWVTSIPQDCAAENTTIEASPANTENVILLQI
jgi:hypothetical protein